ncbi:n-carbamoyl-l-amino acid hydrolase [Apiospora saccharicola]
MASTQNTDLSRKGDMHLWMHDDKYSDIEVQCQGETWLVHRSILGSRSKYFDAIMSGLRKMDAFQPDLLEAIMYFIYTGEVYHVDIEGSTIDYEVLSKLHQLSGFFELQEFQEALIPKIANNLDRSTNYFKQPKNAKRFTKKKLDVFLRAVRVAYEGLEDEQAELRKLYVNFFFKSFPLVAKDDYFYEQIRRMPLFSADLLKALGLKAWGMESNGSTVGRATAGKSTPAKATRS